MFSKEESKRLRQEFWIAFGKSFPRRWTLYHTKIKDLSFKFDFNRRWAMVSIDIEHSDSELRTMYFNKWVSLKSLLLAEIEELTFDSIHLLDNGKEISRIYVKREGVSIHDKATWREAMLFLKENMEKIECFWLDFEDFIKS